MIEKESLIDALANHGNGKGKWQIYNHLESIMEMVEAGASYREIWMALTKGKHIKVSYSWFVRAIKAFNESNGEARKSRSKTRQVSKGGLPSGFVKKAKKKVAKKRTVKKAAKYKHDADSAKKIDELV